MSGGAATLALWLALAPADEGPRGTNPHFEPARKAFEAGEWDAAASAFEAAYAHDGRLEYLYAQAQAERLGGRCEQAVATYRRFIAEGPPQPAVDEANENIARCEPEPAEPPPPRIEPQPPPRSTPPLQERPEAQPRPWYRDPWGGVATFGAVALASTGGALVGIAHDRERDAARAEDEQGYRDTIDGAPQMSRVGIGLLSAGAALLVAGIVRWSWVAVANRRRAR